MGSVVLGGCGGDVGKWGWRSGVRAYSDGMGEAGVEKHEALNKLERDKEKWSCEWKHEMQEEN